MSSPTIGEWATYTVFLTGVAWAMSFMSQADLSQTSAYLKRTGYVNTTIHNKATNLTFALVILTLHAIFIGFAINYKGWIDAATFKLRYEYLLALLIIVLINNVFGWIGKCVFFYNTEHALHTMKDEGKSDVTVEKFIRSKADEHGPLSALVFVVQQLCIAALLVTCLVYIGNAYTTAYTYGTVQGLLLASGIIIFVNYFIFNNWDLSQQAPWGVHGDWKDPKTYGRSGNTVVNSDKISQITNVLSAKIQAAGLHFMPGSMSVAADTLKEQKQQLLASGDKVYSGDSMLAQIKKHYDVTVNENSREVAQALKGNKEAVSFFADGKGLSAVPLDHAVPILKQTPLFEAVKDSSRPIPVTSEIAAMTLGSNSAGVTVEMPVLGQYWGTRYLSHDIWGFARGCSSWFIFRQDSSIPFCMFMLGFYIYFFLDARAAFAAWFITCAPPLIGAITSVNGYFWENFTYFFFYGWMLIVLSTLVVGPSNTEYWYIRNPDRWNVNSSFLYAGDSVTTDLNDSSVLMGVAIASLTVSCMGMIAGIRRLVVVGEKVRPRSQAR